MQTGQWCTKLKTEKVNIREAVLQTIQRQEGAGWYPGIPNDGDKLVQLRPETGTHLQNEYSAELPYTLPPDEGRKIKIVHYVGIAADETKRIKKHMSKPDMVLPLVQIGWQEDLCGLIATYLDMLSPTYEAGCRDGCWFCHNQGVSQLRNLRHTYPELWSILMKWDSDSPVSFHPDGHTVHDFDERFRLEDEGLIDPTRPFKWEMLSQELNYSLWEAL